LQGGLFRDFYRRIGQDPSFDVGQAEGALRAMLKEAGVEVRLEAPLDRLEVEEGRVLALSFTGVRRKAP
jgi:hypothetical protein